MNVRGGTDTYCPFYVREALKSITCEGQVGDCVMHRFKTCAEMRMWQEQYCFGRGYKQCPQAVVLIKAYEKKPCVHMDALGVHEIGTVLSEARRRWGYSQYHLARVTHISRTMIADIERGRRVPSIDTLKILVEALKINV